MPDDLLNMPPTWIAIWGQLADSENLRATIKDMAAAAGVSLATWWRVTNNPDFVTAKQRAMLAACGAEMGRVLHALISTALIIGREGSADRRLVLEMTGMYEPGAAAARERARADDGAARVANMSDEELMEMAESLGIEVPPGVKRRLLAREEQQKGEEG